MRNHQLVVKMAAEARSLCAIARAIGSKNQSVRAYLTAHQIPYLYRHSVGPNNSAWRGGRIVDKDGYVLIWEPEHPFARESGYVPEHRLVMEGVLGRHLKPAEVVHHRDETPAGKQNNDPSNLKLYSTNAEHLADTLRGKVPRWTDDGRRRISEGVRLARAREAASRIARQKTSGRA